MSRVAFPVNSGRQLCGGGDLGDTGLCLLSVREGPQGRLGVWEGAVVLVSPLLTFLNLESFSGGQSPLASY